MDVSTYGLTGEKLRNVKLPSVFETRYRPDLIRRAFTALSTHRLQPKGTDPMAGEKTSAQSWGVGRGASRVPRVKGSQYRRASQAAAVASVVKGRVPHPPRPEKIIHKRINRTERRRALAAAIAATANRDIVVRRGHKVDDVPEIPLILSDDIEGVSAAKDLRRVFESLGLEADLVRVLDRVKKRSGKSRLRGRVSKVPCGPLFVVSKDRGLGKGVGSFPGVDCVEASSLSVEHLAPGGLPGRLVVWSRSAVNSLPEPLLQIGDRVAG